jgi:TRAP transporter TAXI family solute receptor
MPQKISAVLLSVRAMLASAGPFIVLALALLALAYWWLDPNPPKQVTLATGPAQSAYAEFGSRYAKLLAQNGIRVQLVPSEGSSANLQLLRDGKVDLGFVQGGSDETQASSESGIESLGSLFVEPLWLFYQEKAATQATGKATLAAFGQLKGLRVNVGTAGSGVPALMEKLFEVNRLEPGTVRLSKLEQTPATVAFLNGEIDALVFASAPESPMVQMLLQTPGVKLLDFNQNEAYSRRFAFLTAVALPRGVVDLAGDVPGADVRLVAPTTSLLAREGVHPAILQLFAQASLKLHGSAGWFNRAREYPNSANTEFPLAQEADRTIKSGVPLLQRYLPFSMANLVERMWLALGIIVAMLLPLSRIVPPVYQFKIRSRIFRWYGQLRDIEERLGDKQETPANLQRELDALEARVEKITVPLSYSDELYSLRNHIDLVRQRLHKT